MSNISLNPHSAKNNLSLEDDSIPDPLYGDFDDPLPEEEVITPPQKPLILRLIIEHWIVILPVLAILLLARWPEILTNMKYLGIVGAVLYLWGKLQKYILD